MADAWPMITAERQATADLLETLGPDQLSTPSLCAGWTVRDVAGHMISAAEMTPGSFIGGLTRAGFSFNTMTARNLAACRDGDGHQLAARLRAKAGGRNHPPGPTVAMLGEAVVHAEDVRRPLGLPRDVPEATLVAAADFYQGSNLLIGSKGRIAGLRLEATDASWTHGDGPVVRGPMLALVLAMTGRRAAAADLEGEGLATLTGRMAPG